MKYMHSEWRQRLDHWLDTLKKDLYLPLGPIEAAAFPTMEQLAPEEALKGDYAPIAPGDSWGIPYQYLWLRAEVTLPEAARDKRIVMDLNTGGETTVFVDGRSFGTYRASYVDVAHHFIVDNRLTACGEPGRTYQLLLEAYAGHDFPQSAARGGCCTGPVLPGDYEAPPADVPRARMGHMSYGIWNEDAYQLYLDLETLRRLGDQTDPESLRADTIAKALEDATLIVDFEQPPENRVSDYRRARERLRPVLEARNGSTSPLFYAIGNAHLDLAWLWPMAETRRKTSRTFAAQLRLLEEYPEYKYLQSQPAAYVMCRECYPELYARIREAAARGQWIPEGAMWVEPDTNITGGESLVRQLIHGKRFFKEEFGVDSRMLWLPDSFGYSAALPQILKGCGVRYLVTQKIFWSYNEGDRFPYHYFTWEGADGSRIDTFLPTSYTYRTDPEEILTAWRGRVQKRGLSAFLLPFGYGDGGGGPARDHIEYLLREKDLEGMPRTVIESPIRFFEDMEKSGGPQHTYRGELYFSAHRGVYTSQAAIKRGNRKAELALREMEMWGSMAALTGHPYPLKKADALWKKLLLNQFHDILPGSSIKRVYEEARADHRAIIAEADAVMREAQGAMLRPGGVTVFNSLSFERQGLVPLPEEYLSGAVTDTGAPVPVARCGQTVMGLVTVPACGALSIFPGTAAQAPAFVPATARAANGMIELDNGLIRALIDGRGELVSVVSGASGREFAAAPMNRLLTYKDVPRMYDAWDIDSNYIMQEVPPDGPVRVEIVESEGLRAVVRVTRKVLSSDLTQDIILASGSGRIDFKTHVEWRELHRLLKVAFPIDVRAAEGINEIQFGFMTRPTHRSRPYDRDRFEVCNQRYSALCDEGHGAAVLNDCKYGVSMNGDQLELTLLRAPASPEMRADNGPHDFTYALTVWEGSFLDSPVTRQAYDLNVPLQTAPGHCPFFSAFRTDRQNIFIDTVKPAEDGSGDIVLRLYEAKRADTDCVLTFGVPVRSAVLCDMLENELAPLEVTDGTVRLRFHTFEIKTVRIKAGPVDRERKAVL